MKAFVRIMKFLFSIIFILSVSLSVSLYFTSSFKLVLKDDLQIRERIFRYTHKNLDSSISNGLTISHQYYEGENVFFEETIHCKYEDNSLNDCSFIEKKHQKNEEKKTFELVKTTFVNGDGLIYRQEGEDKIKEIYDDSLLIEKAYELKNNFEEYLDNFIEISKENENIFIEYHTKVKFDFNTFTLSKSIDYEKVDNGYKTKLVFNVDSNDRINKINYTESNFLTIDYSSKELQLPSTDGYIVYQ